MNKLATPCDTCFCCLIQHFYRDKTRGKGSSAILEVRRYVLDLFDGIPRLGPSFLILRVKCCKYLIVIFFSALADGHPPLCVVARWSLNFDGFNASARLHCGSTACAFDSDLKTGYIRAYVLYFDVWMRMANRRFSRVASPTLNSTLNKKLSGNGVNSYNGGGVVSGSHPIFVPRGMANIIVGTIIFFLL